jgi:hypothetical protein
MTSLSAPIAGWIYFETIGSQRFTIINKLSNGTENWAKLTTNVNLNEQSLTKWNSWGCVEIESKVSATYPIFDPGSIGDQLININKLYDKASDLMWSNRIYQGTLESLIDLDLDCELFVRPEIDDKLFSGMVCDSLELCDMAKRMIEADRHLAYEKVFVAEVNMPMIEYRLFIVGDEVVTSSKYRENGIVITEHDSPQNVKDIALEFYKRVGMRIPCVIDVAVSENDIGVIEVNSIHNSGFYAIDKEKLIRALAKEFIETW